MVGLDGKQQGKERAVALGHPSPISQPLESCEQTQMWRCLPARDHRSVEAGQQHISDHGCFLPTDGRSTCARASCVCVCGLCQVSTSSSPACAWCCHSRWLIPVGAIKARQGRSFPPYPGPRDHTEPGFQSIERVTLHYNTPIVSSRGNGKPWRTDNSDAKTSLNTLRQGVVSACLLGKW
jgi:hypothetical protein